MLPGPVTTADLLCWRQDIDMLTAGYCLSTLDRLFESVNCLTSALMREIPLTCFTTLVVCRNLLRKLHNTCIFFNVILEQTNSQCFFTRNWVSQSVSEPNINQTHICVGKKQTWHRDFSWLSHHYKTCSFVVSQWGIVDGLNVYWLVGSQWTNQPRKPMY